jgi:hypothetical protein
MQLAADQLAKMAYKAQAQRWTEQRQLLKAAIAASLQLRKSHRDLSHTKQLLQVATTLEMVG